MQSIFRLPWCTDQIPPRVADKVPYDRLYPSPVVDITGLGRLKRKRADSAEPPIAPSDKSKKQRQADIAVSASVLSQDSDSASTTRSTQSLAGISASDGLPPPDHAPSTSVKAGVNSGVTPNLTLATNCQISMPPIAMHGAVAGTRKSDLEQVIENEFNFQILMKHNELRLIEQELAKCQIALEQLRRCEIRPYPGYDAPCESVTLGLGPSILPEPEHSRPPHPVSHGVTDGPYSRHYCRWLLQDPQFDAIPLHTLAAYETPTSNSARATRNSNGSVRKSISRPINVLGTRSVDMHQCLPNYPAPAFKDKSMPLVLRRSTDNQLVKLICNNCLRGNFSSIQGFLNHCRIAHKVDYKSHDAAAIDCGRILEDHEIASLPAENIALPPAKASASRSSSAIVTPQRNSVHPMNVSGAPCLPASASTPTTSQCRKPIATTTAQNSSLATGDCAPFKSATQAPHLSARFAKFRLGGDLEQMIFAAKQKIDFGTEDMLSPDVMDSDLSPMLIGGRRTVAGPGSRPRSSKGPTATTQRARPSPLAPAILQHNHREVVESPMDNTPNLSPTIADSNPGLVSDHEDDDHASQSEDEVPHSATARKIPHSWRVRRGCADHMDIDVTVDDTIDEHGVVIRRNSMIGAEEHDLRPTESSPRGRVVGEK